MEPQAILGVLKKYKFDLSSEEDLKKEMGRVLINHGVDYFREFRLSKADRPDFLIGNTAIEVKIKGRPKDIYKQCERYCKYPEVTNLILVTNKSMGFPDEICGKPCYVLRLGISWL